MWKNVWLESSDGPWLGNLGGWLVGIFDMTPAGGSGRNFGWKFWNGPRLGDPEGILVGKRESEALGETYGDVVGRSKRGCHPVKRTGLDLANVWIGCWVGSVDDRLLRGAKTTVVRSYAPIHLH